MCPKTVLEILKEEKYFLLTRIKLRFLVLISVTDQLNAPILVLE